MKLKIRYVTVRGQIYLHQVDVRNMITELGSTEDTDVRQRLTELTTNIERSLPT